MQVNGSATLVGYRQGQRKDGTPWTTVTLLNNGETVKSFLGRGVVLNGEKERLDRGELIPCDVTFSVRQKGYDQSLEVIALNIKAAK